MLPVFALLIPVLVFGIAFVSLYDQPLEGRLKWLSEHSGQVWFAGMIFLITASLIIVLAR